VKLRALHRTSFARRLRAEDSALREAALDAAAEALRGELQSRTGTNIALRPHGPRRVVGTSDADAAAREFGTLEQLPDPWLAPVLPLALEPMRAAANAAAARAISQIGKRKK
jgi:hypothetical protein